MEKLNHLVSEIYVGYKSQVKASDRPTVTSSKDTAELFRSLFDDETLDFQEQFLVLFLSRNNSVVGYYPTSKGGMTGTVADPRLIMAAALKVPCCAMVLAHNHPSGNLKPSRADEQLTTKIKEAGLLLDIRVLDHIILTRDGYFSFADEGII
jgi:DNA repair protein RadC